MLEMPPQRLQGIACELDILDLVHLIMGVVRLKEETFNAQILIEASRRVQCPDEEMTIVP